MKNGNVTATSGVRVESNRNSLASTSKPNPVQKKGLKVKSAIKAGGLSGNHNAALVRAR